MRVPRLQTGIGELDRVLGGGLVPGSLVLIGGAPGIGKSTITGGALGNLAAAGRNVLYVSGEESPAQVRLRAERLLSPPPTPGTGSGSRSSTIVFHSPQPGQRPCHFGLSFPHWEQTKRVLAAIAPT